MLLFDLDEIQVEPSKHFRNTTMRKRDGDIHDLRDAIGQANRVVGNASPSYGPRREVRRSWSWPITQKRDASS